MKEQKSIKRLLTSDETKKFALEGGLIELDGICREANLRYSIAYGTLPGAARHHGFILWGMI